MKFRIPGGKSSHGIVERLLDKATQVRIINEIANYAATLIDAILITRYLGSDAVSAYGLAMPAFVFLPALGGTIANGVNKLCGNSIGSGDLETTNKAFSSSLIGGISLSLLPMFLLLFLSMPLGVVLGAAGSASGLQVQVSDYLRGMAPGAPAFVLIMILIPFMQINGDHTLLTAAVTGMSVLDIIFDLLCVFVFRGGLFGMALASSLSYWAAALVMSASFLKKERVIRFRFGDWDGHLFYSVLSQGIPYIIRQGCNLLRSLGLNQVVVHLLPVGTLPVYSVVSSMQRVIYTPGSGIGDGTLLVSSMMYGEEDRHALGRTLQEGIRLSFLLNGFVVAAGLIFAPLVMSLYLASDPALIQPAAAGLRLAVLSAIPFSVQIMYRSYLQGINRPSEVVLMTVHNELILPLFSAFILSLLLSVTGFWLSFTIQELLTLLMLFFIIRKKSGKNRIGWETLTMLPPEFGVPEECRISCRIRSQEDVLRFSEQVQQFCVQKRQDERSAMILALCVEEIGVNIFKFGMTQQHQHCEILLYYSADRWTLRFRDDCDAFDPVSYLKSFETEEPGNRFGLRLALSLAREAVYIRSMNVNNLRIRISPAEEAAPAPPPDP